jgi:hypothetical protein
MALRMFLAAARLLAAIKVFHGCYYTHGILKTQAWMARLSSARKGNSATVAGGNEQVSGIL